MASPHVESPFSGEATRRPFPQDRRQNIDQIISSETPEHRQDGQHYGEDQGVRSHPHPPALYGANIAPRIEDEMRRTQSESYKHKHSVLGPQGATGRGKKDPSYGGSNQLPDALLPCSLTWDERLTMSISLENLCIHSFQSGW